MSKAIIAALIVAVLGGLGLGTYDPPSNLIEGGAPDIEPVTSMSPVESIPEPEAVDSYESEPEPSYDPEWYEPEPEPDYWEPEPYVEPEPAYDGGTPDIYTMGVIDDGERTWTWYSSRTLPGNGLTELNENGRTTNDEGFVVDGDGYIAVASPWGQDSIGTVIDTPYGPGKIYDSNEGGSYDLYTCWE